MRHRPAAGHAHRDRGADRLPGRLRPVGNSTELAAATLFQRLLLVVYAYGTNTGIRAVAATDHGHGEDELRYVRRRYMTVESCRQAARVIANATFAARQAWLWGEGSTAAASDSTRFRAWDQNIFTQWHSRYRDGKRSVLIYWTVEKGGAMAGCLNRSPAARPACCATCQPTSRCRRSLASCRSRPRAWPARAVSHRTTGTTKGTRIWPSSAASTHAEANFTPTR